MVSWAAHAGLVMVEEVLATRQFICDILHMLQLLATAEALEGNFKKAYVLAAWTGVSFECISHRTLNQQRLSRLSEM